MGLFVKEELQLEATSHNVTTAAAAQEKAGEIWIDAYSHLDVKLWRGT